MLIKREMALDQDIGLNGALFGGDMMSHMDQTAGIAASLVSYNRRFVTRKVSELIFHSPVRPGDIMEFFAYIIHTGTTSITVSLKVKVYQPISDKRKDVTSGEFTMVAVDESLKPESILWKKDMITQCNKIEEFNA
ncbi:MAG: acyl-CoA thioesterase [Holophagaceae bacterium]|jgi:acyl-CoA thioesterase YciA